MGDNDTRLNDGPSWCAKLREALVAYETEQPDVSLAGWLPTADDCDESEPDERDQRIASLNAEATRWMEDWKALVAENAALRAQIATLTPAVAETPNPLHRALRFSSKGFPR